VQTFCRQGREEGSSDADVRLFFIFRDLWCIRTDKGSEGRRSRFYANIFLGRPLSQNDLNTFTLTKQFGVKLGTKLQR